MIAWLRNLLWDEATFTQYARTAIATFYSAYEMGLLPEFTESSIMWYITRLCIPLALLLRAGDKNR